jgi:glutamine amidotransferase
LQSENSKTSFFPPSMQKIVIIDYGSGNLRSVQNALFSVKNEDQEVVISSNPEDLKTASHIILPGVGAFGDCMSGLKAIPKMIDEIKNQVLVEKKPFLGICVGMQLLADKGYEHGEHEGLGFISGKVVRIDNQNDSLKIPHMGWNDLEIKNNQHCFVKGLKTGDHFYFVHSYHFVCEDEDVVVANVNYEQKINAIIAKDNIMATQFHPEKSSEAGLELLRNFILL